MGDEYVPYLVWGGGFTDIYRCQNLLNVYFKICSFFKGLLYFIKAIEIEI